jgi:hypothetical protein
MTASPFIGVWSLISFVARNASGNEVLPLGNHPIGQLVYTASGYMSAVLSRRERSAFGSQDRRQATTEELQALFNDFDAYCGTFTVDPEASEVTHQVRQSSWPNVIGETYVRHFEFHDGELRLTTPPVLARGEYWVSQLRWQRATNDA